MKPKNQRLIARIEVLLAELDLVSLAEAGKLGPYSASRLYKLSQEEEASRELPFVRLPLPSDSQRVKDRVFVPRDEIPEFVTYRQQRGSEAASVRNQKLFPKKRPPKQKIRSEKE